jgi:hypothetical protein
MEYIMFALPRFDGQNGQRYEMWSISMKTFLEAQGYDVWKSVVTGYTTTKKPYTATKKELKRNNKISMDFILEGLPNSIKIKWENVHQLKNFGISYMISILRNLPSQS